MTVITRAALLSVLGLLSACQPSPPPSDTAQAELRYFDLELALDDYGPLSFFVSRPRDFEAETPVRVLINFPVARQTKPNARALINSPITYQATVRGYVVIVPYGPPRALTGRALDGLPAFLQRLRGEFNVKGGKFDIMGASAGGVTALELAVRASEDIRTVIAYPGYLPSPEPAELEEMAGLCPQIYVGSRDERFRRRLERNLRGFDEAGLAVHAEILDGVGHDFGSFEPERARWLLERLETPPGCANDATANAPSRRAVEPKDS